MSSIAVINNGDGTCSICQLSPKLKGNENDEFLRAANGKSFRVSTLDKIPADRDFRDAWTDDKPTDTVDVDMARARNIHMVRIRNARDEKLKTLDAQELQYLCQNKTLELNQVRAIKQTLRDLPAGLDLTSALTPSDLKLIWPTELK